MVEELVLVDGEMLLVVALTQAVRLAVVHGHVRLLAEATHGREELDALIPRHGIVFIVVDREIGRVDFLDPEDR